MTLHYNILYLHLLLYNNYKFIKILRKQKKNNERSVRSGRTSLIRYDNGGRYIELENNDKSFLSIKRYFNIINSFLEFS